MRRNRVWTRNWEGGRRTFILYLVVFSVTEAAETKKLDRENEELELGRCQIPIIKYIMVQWYGFRDYKRIRLGSRTPSRYLHTQIRQEEDFRFASAVTETAKVKPQMKASALCEMGRLLIYFSKMKQQGKKKEHEIQETVLNVCLLIDEVSRCLSFSRRCGGTVGAILTCPLEVVKTRLQSSSVTLYISEVQLNTMAGASVNRVVSPGPLHCLKVILEKEGPRSLFRGLGPNLVGVAPSRAIYFAAYSNCKEKLNGIFDPDSTQVHMISAAMAGFTAITATNPIWLIKTRLQLDARNRGEKRMGAFECIRKVYQTDGLRGFYRGMSASYAGISETVIHFVIYESIKQKLLEYKIASTMENDEESVKEASDFVGMMLAAATSKTCATTIAYPHEVVRTRLREEGTKYRSFFQTLSLVVQEEGYGSLYRGLTTHLVRQIPNTAIMMATYELVVYLLNG
nr:solute carrier family 25 member 36 [Vulpes vulpes]